ncbi:copia protein [Tanacetum coccineum]
MNMDQDRHMLMVDDNVGNQFRQNAVHNVGNLVGHNVVQNQARAEANGNGINGNQIRCYNCQGVDHYANNCTVKPRKWDAAYLHKQMQIAQKEEAGIQLTSKEFDFMAAAGACEETERANANCTLENNLQQASTSGTQSDKAPVYDSERTSAELSMEKSTVSSLQEEKKRLKSDFKIREDELLDKQIQLENKIKELNNILVKTGQSIQTMHMLSPKPDSFYHTEQKMALGYQNPFYLKQAQQKQQSLYNGKAILEKHDPPAVYDSEETLELAQESRLKMKQLNKEIKPANYTKINHLLRGFCFSNGQVT